MRPLENILILQRKRDRNVGAPVTAAKRQKHLIGRPLPRPQSGYQYVGVKHGLYHLVKKQCLTGLGRLTREIRLLLCDHQPRAKAGWYWAAA